MKDGISIKAKIITINGDFGVFIDKEMLTSMQLAYLAKHKFTDVDLIIEKDMSTLDLLIHTHDIVVPNDIKCTEDNVDEVLTSSTCLIGTNKFNCKLCKCISCASYKTYCDSCVQCKLKSIGRLLSCNNYK